jgi:hypothetical protein
MIDTLAGCSFTKRSQFDPVRRQGEPPPVPRPGSSNLCCFRRDAKEDRGLAAVVLARAFKGHFSSTDQGGRNRWCSVHEARGSGLVLQPKCR